MSTFPESGYKIQNIIVLESFFKREVIIDFTIKIENLTDVRNGHQITPEGLYVVEVEANLKGIQKETNFQCYEAKLRIVGVFEKSGEPVLSDDIFVKVNAPAIIFPFVREHFANLALKAGIGNVLLPPLNFTKQ